MHSVSEGDGSVDICVLLLGSTERDIDITISTEAGTAQGCIAVAVVNI